MHVYIMHTYINAVTSSKLMFGQIIWPVNRVSVPMIAYRNGPDILK